MSIGKAARTAPTVQDRLGIMNDLPEDEVKAARERGRKLAEKTNDGIALTCIEHPPGAIEKVAAAIGSLEQNERGEPFPPGHLNEDIDEIGQSDQLAREGRKECEKHGHLWDPKTGDCNQEGCEANYYKPYYTVNDHQEYYDKKMEHRYEMMPLLTVLFFVGIVMVVIAYFFNL